MSKYCFTVQLKDSHSETKTQIFPLMLSVKMFGEKCVDPDQMLETSIRTGATLFAQSKGIQKIKRLNENKAVRQ